MFLVLFLKQKTRAIIKIALFICLKTYYNNKEVSGEDIKMNFNKLSLIEKFGQTILLGLDTYEINDEIIKIIEDYKIGGVVLYKKNYTSIQNMIDFINNLKKYNQKNKIPLFIAIDQENGRVNRFPKDIICIRSALKQSNTHNIKLINAINLLTCYVLNSVGVNMNFAPVLDILHNDKNRAIGNRSYGYNIEDVIKYGIPFMHAMQKNSIISVVKHFPGHGATNKDSHFIIPKIKDVNILENEDIKPFYTAINEGADALMVGHLKLKGFGSKPASINKKIIQEYLIKENRFNGLIITDDLRMNILQRIYGLKNCVKNSINAGNNMVMIKYQKGDYKLYQKIFKSVQLCEIDPELINNSAKKIIAMKKKYNVNNEIIRNKLDIDLINSKIKKFNDMIDRENEIIL